MKFPDRKYIFQMNFNFMKSGAAPLYRFLMSIRYRHCSLHHVHASLIPRRALQYPFQFFNFQIKYCQQFDPFFFFFFFFLASLICSYACLEYTADSVNYCL